MDILVRILSAFTRNFQSNQALTAHSTAVKHIHSNLIPITRVRFCVRQECCMSYSLKFYSLSLQYVTHGELPTGLPHRAPSLLSRHKLGDWKDFGKSRIRPMPLSRSSAPASL